MYFERVGLEEALEEILDRNAGDIFSIDDAMRQFAREPGAPKGGDYRLTGKGSSKEDRASRAYVVQRIQKEAGFQIGGRTPKGKPQQPRQAQRIVAQGVKEPRSITAKRWKEIQWGARRSLALSRLAGGTYVHIRAQFTITSSNGDEDARPIRTIHLEPMVPTGKRATQAWKRFLEEWRPPGADHSDATQQWEVAFFASFLQSGTGTIEEVEWLVMTVIATKQDLEEVKRESRGAA